ncbi:MAG: DHH family phosphoesterase [Clostridia bacterium]|nr:DHH family phosphoesterase [Clostridia bacterium]
MKKRRIWMTSPICYAMVVVLFVMTALSWKHNKVLFAVELTISILAAVSVLMTDLHYRLHIHTALRTARKVLSADEEHEFDQFALPIVVLGNLGDIIWSNQRFRDQFAENEESRGNNIAAYIYPKTLRQILSESGTAISFGEKEYTAYGLRAGSSCVVYFVDDTYYKQIHREFREKHTVVALISFDNREELARDSAGGEDSRLTAEVENVLRRWATDEMGGFLRRLTNGRYMLITDEQHIVQARQKRFSVLDQVRAIKDDSDLPATVSVGIGRGSPTAALSELHARQALDMALGRGGDQVAVRLQDGTYEFFGGLSKGVEKRDKVRTRVIAATLSDHIKSSDRVFIMGHANSDLDSVGSAVGMWAAVTKGLQCRASVVIDRNRSMASGLIHTFDHLPEYADLFITPQEALDLCTPRSLLIVVDTHSTNFVESQDVLRAISRVVVIDHHRMMVTHIKNAIIFYHEPYASSASEMVGELVQYINSSALNKREATAMLAGIMLDTKNFVLKTGVRTFEASAYLKRRGADTVEVKKMFANSLDTYKERSQLVAGAEVYKNCAIACSNWEFPNIRIAAAQAADELLSIQNVRASFVLFRVGNEICISARSLGDVNVQILLEEFGGGGHLNMAGAQVKNSTTEEVRKALLRVLDQKLLEASRNDN